MDIIMHLLCFELFNTQFEWTIIGSWHPRDQDKTGLNP